MRILSLELVAFGVHRDVRLDFAPEGEPTAGLQVIHGPNEAGKSTARRALAGFFFRIPHHSSDAHLTKATLEVGVRLLDSEGRVHHLRRRKKLKDSLVDGDSGEPVDEAVLTRMLGGIDEALFDRLFGIDHVSLREGGEALLGGAGRMDRALAGAARLGEVLDGLREEATALYTPRKKVATINRLLTSLKEARGAARAEAIDPQDWDAAQEALARARARRDQLVAELGEVETSTSRNDRLVQSFALLRERAGIDAALGAAEALDELGEDWLERRTARHAERLDLEERARDLDAQRADTERELAALGDDTGLLEHAVAIRVLAGEAAAHAEICARLDEDAWSLPEESETEARLANAEDLEETLRAARSLAEAARDDALLDAGRRDRLVELEAELGRDRDELATLPEAEQGHVLADLAARLRELGRRDDEVRDDEATLAEAAASLEARLRDAAGWREGGEVLLHAALPPTESLEDARDRLRELERARDALLDESLRLDAARDELETELRVLQETEATPDPRDIKEGRARRDADWAEIRRRWLEGLAPGAEARDDASLARSHEEGTREADLLADRLLAGASANERRTRLRAELDAKIRQRERLRARLEEIEDETRRDRERAAAAWGELPLEIADVAAMVAVRRELDAIRERLRDLSTRRSRLAARRHDLEEVRGKIDADLRGAGLTPLAADENAGLRAAELERRASEAGELAGRRRTLEVGLERMVAERGRLETEAAEAAARAAERRRRWDLLRRDLELDEEAAEPSLALVEEQGRRRQRARDRRRVRAFRRELSRIAGAVAPELNERLATSPALPVLTALNDRLEEAQKTAGRREELGRQREKLRAQADDLEARLERAVTEIGRLEERLEAPDDAARDALVQRLRERIAQRRRRAEIEATLRQIGANDLESLAREAAEADPDLLRGRAAEFASRRRELSEALEHAQREHGRRERALEELQERRGAADRTVEIASDSARLLELARRHRVLERAAAILQAELDRFRARNQGPVLERASVLFSRLTGGSFASVEADWNEAREEVVKARRPGEEALGMDALSAGTRDQLFLALKIATVENLVASGRHGAMPIVLDDVLVHFDDDRGRAALETLAEVGRNVQVILFTHHRSTAEAAAALGPERARVHELGARAEEARGETTSA